MTKDKGLSKKAGLPPGTLVHIGKDRTNAVKISVIDYGENEFEKKEFTKVEKCFPFKEKDTNSWINIDGVHRVRPLESIRDHFGLHPLLMEDIMNTAHRPKTESFATCVFCTLKMIGINEDANSLVMEQVSFVLGKKWLISFQEQQGDIYDSLRTRLEENTGLVRKKGIDYLLYRLIDTVVDNYFFVSEYFHDTGERLEEQVLEDATIERLQELQTLKKQLAMFRRSVGPLKEAVGSLQRESSELIEEGTNRYLRDVYEHLVQLNDSIDAQRDQFANIMDLYLSGVSNKMNRTMQVLTIIATIFIPLTFIAGIYGMNFEIMPELKWKYGYLGVWMLMIVIIMVMIRFFKKRQWL